MSTSLIIEQKNQNAHKEISKVQDNQMLISFDKYRRVYLFIGSVVHVL